MGYREDVVIAVESEGWNQLLSFIKTLDSIDSAKAESVINLIEKCVDEHVVNDNGDHMLAYTAIKTSADDYEALVELLQSGAIRGNGGVDRDKWLIQSVGEDGAEETYGDWFDNPFAIGVRHSLEYDVGDTTHVSGSILPGWKSKQVSPAATIQSVRPTGKPINNHTCTQCGNSACSKTEKSCWKCGAAIVA